MIVSSTQKKNPNKTKAKKTHPQPTVWILQRQRKVLMLPFFFHFQQHTLWREIFAPLLLGQKLTHTITSVLALNLREILLPWISPLLRQRASLSAAVFFSHYPFSSQLTTCTQVQCAYGDARGGDGSKATNTRWEISSPGTFLA